MREVAQLASNQAIDLDQGKTFARFVAIVGTQIIAVLSCLFGILVPALPWQLIVIVRVYVLAATLLTDWIKSAFHKALDRRELRSQQLTQPLTGSAAAVAAGQR